MEQIFFLALLAIVGLLRWFSQMAEERRNREAEKHSTPAPDTTVQRAPAQTEEERIRRFMEALGVPTSNTPIPRAEPKRDVPKPTVAPKQTAPPIDPFPRGGGFPIPPIVAAPPPPPPAPQQPTVVPPRPVFTAPPPTVPAAPPLLPTRETTMFAPPPSVEFEVREITDSIDEPAPAIGSRREQSTSAKRADKRELSVAARLATAGGLRGAIVLREIFGPPRSMQPLDLTRAA